MSRRNPGEIKFASGPGAIIAERKMDPERRIDYIGSKRSAVPQYTATILPGNVATVKTLTLDQALKNSHQYPRPVFNDKTAALPKIEPSLSKKDEDETLLKKNSKTKTEVKVAESVTTEKVATSDKEIKDEITTKNGE